MLDPPAVDLACTEQRQRIGPELTGDGVSAFGLHPPLVNAVRRVGGQEQIERRRLLAGSR